VNNKQPKRSASEEERALFRDVLKGVEPLRRAKAAAPKTLPKVKPTMKSTPLPNPPRRETESVSEIGGHLEARLRRGRVEPAATLDLHGFRETEAYRALERFLIRAHGEDKRLVLVITGKGGVLQKNLPRWLAEHPLCKLMVGISPAHIRHGGAGAFYVALRKTKQN
jgi:DNA-nicking Smr family endonuclease